MKTIAIANQKGGVGKTTVSRNLAFYLREQGLRVLCGDLDHQRNFTKTMLGLWDMNHEGEDRPSSLTSTMLFQDEPAKLKPLECGSGISLIAGERSLVDVQSMPLEAIMYPRAALARLAKDFDVCVLDTSPGLGTPLYAALVASDYVVCPCSMDQDAIDGLGDLFEDIERVRQLGWNQNLRSLGLLANRVNRRRAQDLNALQQLRDELPGLVRQDVLYDRAATQYAKDRPVWRVASGESQRAAAREMRAVCASIYHDIQNS